MYLKSNAGCVKIMKLQQNISIWKAEIEIEKATKDLRVQSCIEYILIYVQAKP